MNLNRFTKKRLFIKLPLIAYLVYFLTRVPEMSDTSATRVRHERHECSTKVTSATQVKNFDFDNETSENIFSHPYISYMANERLQRGKQLRTENYPLEMHRSNANTSEKCSTKSEPCNHESYIKKLYTRL